MGHKIHTWALRKEPFHNTWVTKENNYAKCVQDLVKIREIIPTVLDKTLYSDINVINLTMEIIVIINTHRSSAVADKIEQITETLTKKLFKDELSKRTVSVKLKQTEHPAADPIIISRRIGQIMESGKDIKNAINQEIRAISHPSSSVLGIIIIIKGVFKGKMATVFKKKSGSVPRHTISADVNTHVEHVSLKLGMCSVRIYISKKR